MSLGDVYYVLFRHKWKILVISALGILVAMLLPFAWPLPYQSEAKLFIRYVLETKSPSQINPGEAKATEQRGEGVINTELEILTSLDLAQEVADAVGPAKILAKVGGGTDRLAAAGFIHSRLVAEVVKQGSVIRLLFRHPDRDVVQPVLNQFIESYFKKHAEIHRSAGAVDDFLLQETDQLKSQLMRTETELRRAKTNLHVISIEDSKKVFAEQSSRIQQGIYETEAELAEREATVSELSRLLHAKPATPSTNSTSTVAPVPSDKIAKYKAVLGFLDALSRKHENLLLQGLSAESSPAKALDEQIAKNEAVKKTLEDENPGLLAIAVAEPKASESGTGSNQRTDLVTEIAKLAALQAKVKVLTNQLNNIRLKAAMVDEMEGSITDLQRKKELEEQNYKYFAANLEQSRINEALGPGRASNIVPIQAPSPPYRDDTKLQKVRYLALFGSIAAALALAFLLELYLDRSLKRPGEIEGKLGLPLFISIPLMRQNGKARLLKGGRKRALLGAGEDPQKKSVGHASENRDVVTSGELQSADSKLAHPLVSIPVWDARHELRPFSETLRDRLIAFFELKNLTHKPKLVAVTSCSPGAGVTTVAGGLAASLSETGEGNVLLVDMHTAGGEAHDFHRGKLTCGLADALEPDRRSEALVQENLYVVSESANGFAATNGENGAEGDKLPRVLPKRFNRLLPRLKASDYDYIIFDMPSISEISVTSRLARFMDMVLVVVESEKTDRDLVKRAVAMISEPKPNIGVVLNKRKTYVPKLLQQEL
jgi:uncharacterized protein involved in exopolysaccharide biosynthesis/Mrp family chromosome partitioning ATPase